MSKSQALRENHETHLQEIAVMVGTHDVPVTVSMRPANKVFERLVLATDREGIHASGKAKHS